MLQILKCWTLVAVVIKELASLPWFGSVNAYRKEYILGGYYAPFTHLYELLTIKVNIRQFSTYPATNSSKLSKGWQVLLLLNLRSTKSCSSEKKNREEQKHGSVVAQPTLAKFQIRLYEIVSIKKS